MGNWKLSHEENRDMTRDRFHIMLKSGAIPGIIHFGRLRYSKAQPPLPVHEHENEMEICYLDGGKQVFYVNGKRYCLKGGDIFVTYPNEPHSTDQLPMEKSTLYWVGIDLIGHKKNFLGYAEPEIKTLRDQLINLKPRHFRGGPVLREILEKALNAYFSETELSRIMFRNHITEFLIEACRFARRKKNMSVSSLMHDIQGYVKSHVSEPLTVGLLADQAGLSIPRFKQRFKKETGVAPNEFILREKIDEAKRLLTVHHCRITAAALDTGFSSSQYFATVFKRYTGMTPREFLKTGKKGIHHS